MKILLLNQDWFADEFRSSGHEVVSCGIRPHFDYVIDQPLVSLQLILRNQMNDYEPDIIICYDDSAPFLYFGLEDIDTPVVFYSVDAHHHAHNHAYFAQVCDQTYVAQRDYLPFFEKVGVAAQWLPLWASRYMEPVKEREYGAVFVGTMDRRLNRERVEFFEELGKLVPILCTTGEYWNIFPRSELVVNQTVKGDLNFRVFEAMMSGAMLLTEDSPNGLNQLFRSGEELVTYTKNDVTTAASQIDYYLHKPTVARQIGLAGREAILCSHLPQHRAAQMLQDISRISNTALPRRCLSLLPNTWWLARGLLKLRPNKSIYVLTRGLVLIEKAIERGEAIEGDLVYYAVRCCLEFDRLTHGDSGSKLLDRLAECAQDNATIAVARLWKMLNRGQVEAATRTVRDLTTEDPKVIFQQVNDVVLNLLGGVDDDNMSES